MSGETDEYNYALGLKKSNPVKEVLVVNGVSLTSFSFFR